MKEAPLYLHAHDLARWLLANLAPDSCLEERLHRDALALLDHIVLALKGFDRDHHLDEADATAAVLRARLRLARDLERLDDRRLVFLTDQLDQIGRQIGGWQRRLAADTMEPRHR